MGDLLHMENVLKRWGVLALATILVFTIAACGGDDEIAEGDAPTTTSADSGSGDTPTTTPTTSAPATPPSGGATATVTLDNGETYEFGILCHLERQEAAGAEILFTVVSYDDPINLDVTQFGADSFGGAANIGLYDSTSYDAVWEADSTYGTSVELSLNGSTVTGSGDFYPGGDIQQTPVPGELVANC
ncbi:MAG: hypothetical protein DWP92_02970 [Armatimonadetes bacterium]|nr:MAG: hypothetical protein DWP92_02970 [Armatimonadota bacterium]